MAKIVQKWLKMAENSWKWIEMDGNGQKIPWPKWPKQQKWPQIAKNG